MHNSRALSILLLPVVCGISACDISFSAPSPTINITNLNTNNNDSHDTFNFNPTVPPPTTTPTPPGTTEPAPGTTLPIPADAQSIATAAANSNQGAFYLSQSCQDKFGAAGWNFMDFIVTALKAKDTRWGYLCKNGNCNDISKDVIAYRATNDTIGLWAVDIIGNHCPVSPAVSTFTWNVLGFDPAAIWKETR